jgi:excisionase family DNA binding protein
MSERRDTFTVPQSDQPPRDRAPMANPQGRTGGPSNETDLTIRECAERLRVSDRTILRFIASGELKARRVGRKLWRVRAADLSEFYTSGSDS